MARIRADLVGAVLVTLPGSSDPLALTAGQKVPEGIEVGDHVLEPGSGSTPATPATPEADAAAKAVAKAAKKAAKHAAKEAAAATAAADPGSTPPPPAELVPPPLNGAGSSTEVWREYALAATKAAGLSIEIPADAKRSDIVDALTSASIRTE